MLKNVKIFYEADVDFSKRSFHRVILTFIKQFGFKIEALSVFFIDDKTILEINKAYLNHNYATDVITLNYSKKKNIIDAEIFISVETAKMNSRYYAVKIKEELLRYLVHGLLHLAGYNDKTKLNRKKMKIVEDEFVINYRHLIVK